MEGKRTMKHVFNLEKEIQLWWRTNIFGSASVTSLII